MENSDKQQVVQAVNLPDATTDSLMLSKLVTFVLLMVWLGLTASAFFIRSFVPCLHLVFFFVFHVFSSCFLFCELTHSES